MLASYTAFFKDQYFSPIIYLDLNFFALSPVALNWIMYKINTILSIVYIFKTIFKVSQLIFLFIQTTSSKWCFPVK